MSRLLEHPEALCNIVRRIALEAGEKTLDYFEGRIGIGLDEKSDGSPVTCADKDAEKIITEQLLSYLPDIPIIAEEAVSEGRIPDIDDQGYFWLVDPLDGTKEFISGSGDYTVNIALIYQGLPVLGVVYAPAKDELYAGFGPDTALRWSEDGGKDKPISVRDWPSAGLTIVSSRSHGSAEALEAYLSDYKVQKIVKRGSSLKICAVAAGKADLYPRFGPTCEWDTAAGDAVLRSAGGIMTDIEGHPLRYGKSAEKFYNPHFIAKGVIEE
jgi:3'(2'), 5'-bisphosphate nucleotidase